MGFRHVEKPYKTNGNEAFWSPKPKKASKNIEKALPREGFRIAFPQSGKPCKTNGKTTFPEVKKRYQETL